MEHPLQHLPLAVLDPTSVNVEDCVLQHGYGFSTTGKPMIQSVVKHNENHRWVYFPQMTKDEVLLFTQFEQFKGVNNKLPGAKVLTNFHTAFVDPNAGETKEERKSCEHRV
jgi:hypothetical protein